MIDDYRKARKLGRREANRSLSDGRNPFPPALDEIMRGRPFARETSIGMREIPLDLVVGTRTRGRQNLFSEGFLPLAEEGSEFAAKWSNLYDAQVSEGFRDPIVAFEFLQRFYVQEGNKRVSVARYVGMPSIHANITRVVPLYGMGFDEELVRYEEFERFFRVASLYDLVFSHVGDYGRLAQLLGRDLNEAWPAEDVEHLKATFAMFEAAFAKRKEKHLDCSVSDAFLRYVQTYATKDPLDATAASMEERVRSAWDELVVAARPDAIAFVPEPTQSKQGVVSKVVLRSRAQKPTRIAFVYDRTPHTSGWTLLHEQGRLELERRFGSAIDTVSFEGCVSNESFEAAVREAVADDCALVVTTSPRQMEQTRRAAVAYPKCQFLNCSINLTSHAVRTFYARMYEVKFLMGALAASLSQSHQLGYVAFSPINGAVSEVNAFALGAALVDPYATVNLKWLSSNTNWKAELAELGVDVIADRDYSDPAAPVAPFGLYALNGGDVLPIATPIWDWARYYELLLRQFGVGGSSGEKAEKVAKGQAINYWWGMGTGVVRLRLANGVSFGQRRLVDLLRRALLEGQISPFDTVLTDQRGNVVRAESDEPLSDEQIATMSWLNVNVAGSLPRAEELSSGGKADVEAAGVAAPRDVERVR